MLRKMIVSSLAIVSLVSLSAACCGAPACPPAANTDTTQQVICDSVARANCRRACTKNSGASVELAPQALCPVMGGAINKEIYADHNGKRVYFCCPGCIGTFNADPEKYLQILEENGEAAEDIEG